jgi:uncharacterized membrane protein/pimeloyl-ACP methyl ester carboxylesterase
MIAGDGLSLASLLFDTPGFGPLGSLIVAGSVAAALLAYTTGLRWRQETRPTRFVLLGLRLGAIVCLLLTILHPAWMSERTVDEKPIVAVVLDDSASMAEATERRSDEATKGGGDETRYGLAVALLTEELMPKLAESHRLRLYDVEARALQADELPADAIGQRSPLTDALLRVQSDLRDEPLVGIALLSDGAETSDRPAVGGPEQLHVPVHTIDVAGSAGESLQAADLAVQAVSANRRALVGNTVRVFVDVAAEGRLCAGQTPVALLDSGEVVAARTISWQAGERLTRVGLEFVPRRPGEFTYTVAVGGLPGEADLANNRQTFPLAVSAKPLTVLYVDGVLRWEGKFIREALGADPDINVISSVRTARVGADRGSQGLLLPEQLSNVDVVILGDVEATYFSTSDELAALCSWVSDGGSLVLTGGYHSFGPQGFGRTALRDILPVEFSASANPQIEQPFNLKLTDAGREHPIFQLTRDRVRDTAFFNKLPALDGCSRIAAVKPGAEVLAVNPRLGGPEGAQGLPIMIVQQVGAGRSLVLAVDTTWRWRLVVGGFTGDSSFYERFWGQLVRWMASDRTEAPQRLFASTDRSRYRLGDTIELTIKLQNVAAGPRTGRSESVGDIPSGSHDAVSGWEVSVQALDESGQQAHVPLAELGEGRYRGTLSARRPGRLDLTVSAEPMPRADRAGSDSDRQAQSRVVTVQVDRPDIETLNPLPNPQWLAQVAQRSGGRSIRPEQIGAWAAELPADPVRTTVRRTSGTWGDSIFGSAFLLLLCAEWILRRRSQLA